MIAERWLARALAVSVCGAIAAQAAELPAQTRKPVKPDSAKTCDVAGRPGVLAANGVCVRLSGYISTQFSAGQLNGQMK